MLLQVFNSSIYRPVSVRVHAFYAKAQVSSSRNFQVNFSRLFTLQRCPLTTLLPFGEGIIFCRYVKNDMVSTIGVQSSRATILMCYSQPNFLDIGRSLCLKLDLGQLLPYFVSVDLSTPPNPQHTSYFVDTFQGFTSLMWVSDTSELS